MSDDMNPGARRRKQAKDKVRQARDRADTALENVNGNPQTIEAIEALHSELDALEEFLNFEG